MTGRGSVRSGFLYLLVGGLAACQAISGFGDFETGPDTGVTTSTSAAGGSSGNGGGMGGMDATTSSGTAGGSACKDNGDCGTGMFCVEGSGDCDICGYVPTEAQTCSSPPCPGPCMMAGNQPFCDASCAINPNGLFCGEAMKNLPSDTSAVVFDCGDSCEGTDVVCLGDYPCTVRASSGTFNVQCGAGACHVECTGSCNITVNCGANECIGMSTNPAQITMNKLGSCDCKLDGSPC